MNNFDQLKNIIESRRTTKTASMNGKKIPHEQVQHILHLADWAPTHGRTEPWRFYVYTDTALIEFGQVHGDLYWQNTPEDRRMEATREKLTHTPDGASHLVVAVMKRGENVKIPQLEEIAATSAAIQNILLGATALGIATFWNTGGLTHHKAFKEYLQLGDDDLVMGLIYMGYTDEPAKEGKRNTPISEKIHWM